MERDPHPEVRGVEVEIPVTGASVGGILAVPKHAEGIVLFAHGAGSSRFSPAIVPTCSTSSC